ncbi:prepilin peptidase [Streptomyces sulfonofaciens]|uniref:Prepilin peptidase n=1 Tax=Streptomyces sulfonofaciens TaxID=68272 RepID=A0A919KZF7_9ACTN|nr:A24 family peptidase [Streptomyces sulfonofaciens]GHH77351.1 prepilin peptidase [Streptomyces sulfonofaciens]
MHVLLLVVAAVWGAGSGLLVPRAAYRLAVQPDEHWRAACPGGHPITGPFGGWLGRARCAGAPEWEKGAYGTGPATGAPGPPTDTPADAPTPGGGAPGGGAPAGSAPAGSASCPARYGPRAPLVAAVTALLCLALAAATGARPEAAVWLAAVPVAVLLALVDHAVHRLPDVLTLPLAAGLLALLGVVALLPGHRGSWPGALLGALVLGAGYFVLFLVNSKGMGFGDVKLALALGAVLGWYGWTVLLVGFVAGLVLGGAYGIGLMVLRRADRKSAIPLGPFMLGGAFLGLLLGAV